MKPDPDYDNRCLDDREENTCRGPVEFHTIDGLSSWPRCDHHFDERLKRSENSMERYANSDVIPSWFSPEDAGESWFEDE